MKIGEISKKLSGYKARRQVRVLQRLKKKRQILEARAVRSNLAKKELKKIAEAKKIIYAGKKKSNLTKSLLGSAKFLGKIGSNVNKNLAGKGKSGLNFKKGLKNIPF